MSQFFYRRLVGLATTHLLVVASLAGCGSQPESAAPLPPAEPFTLMVRHHADPTRVTVVVRADGDQFAALPAGLPDGLVEMGTPERLLGSCKRVGQNEIHFEPAFPLLHGHEYEIRFDASVAPGLGQTRLVEHFRIPPAPLAPPPRLSALYPSSKTLPSNHLKFYLVFSEPMQPGDIWSNFSLIDLKDNRPVPRPFRHTELWSRDQKRLTLWFHPGRVKQGVNLNVELGPILREGRPYRLIVSGDWLSARGVPLGDDVTKTFQAGPADHDQPDPLRWRMEIPRAATRQPLRCDLGEPLDWALLHSDLVVVDQSGTPVEGIVKTEAAESVWVFTPQRPWKAATFRLAVSSVLEDLAGNSVERPFEVDITDTKSTPKPVRVSDTVFREFTVKEPKSD